MIEASNIVIGTIADDEEGRIVLISLDLPCGQQVAGRFPPEATRRIISALTSACEEVEAMQAGAAALLAKYLAQEASHD